MTLINPDTTEWENIVQKFFHSFFFLFFYPGGFLFVACKLIIVGISVSGAAEPNVRISDSGELSYATDSHGNSIPDFSFCGYDTGSSPLPQVPIKIVVIPIDGDDTRRIQAAIDYVAGLPRSENGYRGAIRLAPGEFQIEGQIVIQSRGIVLQGSGASEGGTTLVATGQDRRALIKVIGVDDRKFREMPSVQEIRGDYIAVGTKEFRVNSAESLSVGDSIVITRPSTPEWIEEVGGRADGIGWKPGSRDILWDRTVTDISENTLTVDAPITTSLEKQFGGGTIEVYDWPGRVSEVGIEDLRLESSYDPQNHKDEDHSWFGITMDNAQDAWARRIVFEHFAGGAVALGRNTRSITVEDCIALAPISEDGGYRRHTYFTQGQLTLFNRCWSELGRHDFSVGHCAPGPNAFVNCRADRALGESGPIESWASGVLFDNVRIDGNDLQLQNRWNSPPGTGWAAANCVLWQCRAANVRCFRPPGAYNWAIGIWATPAGDGAFHGLSDFVSPQSLYQAQLRDRLGKEAAARIDPILGKPTAATNPTYHEAEEFLKQSVKPARRLVDDIQTILTVATAARLLETTTEQYRRAVDFEDLPIPELQSASPQASSASDGVKLISINNGWLVANGQLLAGKRLKPSWWRGSLRPSEAAEFGHNISRFAPGREGLGLTEDIATVAEDMVSTNTLTYEHHYGLWYDRRRDDHLMVRRADGAVAPPFYEQPFARSGEGFAWDGLSKYDLTKNNPWYWNRLREFAQLCDENGLVLLHNNYFQHNILEAGAHWADSPWRPANNINDTGLPEPPPYIGDKRLFMAQHFYDVSDPNLRELHRRYIHQCLEAFADCTNVLQLTSAEFTGPLEFVQFWIDTIVEWEQETGNNVLVTLSCTKDVQDAILADPEREPFVDVIDIRYWTYDKNYQLYAPEGGKYLAPRQHMRQLKPETASFSSIVKSVSEYRHKFPDKVVLYNADLECRSPTEGWAVLIGGGSLPVLTLPPELARKIPQMVPTDKYITGKDQWCLATSSGEMLIYFQNPSQEFKLDLPTEVEKIRAQWIDSRTGKITETSDMEVEGILGGIPKTNVVWITPS